MESLYWIVIRQASEKIKLCSMLTKEKKCEFYNNFSKNAGAAGASFKQPESGEPNNLPELFIK